MPSERDDQEIAGSENQKGIREYDGTCQGQRIDHKPRSKEPKAL
jgi:hypothetical protein